MHRNMSCPHSLPTALPNPNVYGEGSQYTQKYLVDDSSNCKNVLKYEKATIQRLNAQYNITFQVKTQFVLLLWMVQRGWFVAKNV